MSDRHRFRGALLGALVGDVLGAPFEGHAGVVPAPALVELLDASSTLPCTDDTALTIALAESLLRVGGLDEEDVARGFADAWAVAPDLGYSTRTAAWLRSIHEEGSWSADQVRHGQATNGGAMRVAPVALWTVGRRADTAGQARRSARVTHDDPGAADGAAAQAVAVATALDQRFDEPVDATAFVATVQAVVTAPLLAAGLEIALELSQRGNAAEIEHGVGTGALACESVPAAICAFLSHPDSFADAVTLAISLGGDADTIGSMTGAISGALLGEISIPTRWLARTTLATRVTTLADALYSAVVQH